MYFNNIKSIVYFFIYIIQYTFVLLYIPQYIILFFTFPVLFIDYCEQPIVNIVMVLMYSVPSALYPKEASACLVRLYCRAPLFLGVSTDCVFDLC